MVAEGFAPFGRLAVDVEMAPRRLGVMCVLLVIEFNRNPNQLSVPHADSR